MTQMLHRSREHPTPDPQEPPLKQIKFYLDRYRIKEALQIFFDENTLRLLRDESDFMWDVIPVICKRLRGLCQYRFRVFEGCERMLCRIAVDENCNPKEVLISLLAEVTQQDEYNDDNVFRAMIRPLSGTLIRMSQPSPRDENFKWVLNVLMRHVNDIELPQEYNLEGKKRLALPNDPSVKRFIEVLPLMLSFMEEFEDRPTDYEKSAMPILTESQINEVLNGELVDDDLLNENNPSRIDTVNSSVTALSSLIYRPLTFLDLSTYCADLRLFSNRCLNTLLKLRPNLFSPIYKRLVERSSTLDTERNESFIPLGTCSYLFRCERIIPLEMIQSMPQVITHESLLTCHMPYVVCLLEQTEILVHEKGLLLLDSLLRRIGNESLDQKFLDLFEKSSLLKQLFRIMVFSPLCTNRRKAFDMFSCLGDLLDYDCKVKLFRYVLAQEDLRPCIRAACIDLYRKHLTNVYKEQTQSKYKSIGGQVLVDFLDLCMKNCLPESQHTHIIENYELLMATLTFFRFLKLRKTADEVEKEYLAGKRLKTFFDLIRKAITLIKIELNQQHLDEADCLNWALCQLDLVESVLVLTSDLYNC